MSQKIFSIFTQFSYLFCCQYNKGYVRWFVVWGNHLKKNSSFCKWLIKGISNNKKHPKKFFFSSYVFSTRIRIRILRDVASRNHKDWVNWKVEDEFYGFSRKVLQVKIFQLVSNIQINMRTYKNSTQLYFLHVKSKVNLLFLHLIAIFVEWAKDGRKSEWNISHLYAFESAWNLSISKQNFFFFILQMHTQF
jgi:hypothetical protein